MPSNTPPGGRRVLHFDRLDEVTADVRKLVEADHRQSLRQAGSWTFGQTLGHLASWVNYGYDGVPVKIPFFVPWIMRPLKRFVLNRPMKPGARIPRVPGGTLAIEVISTEAAIPQFFEAFDRLAKSRPTQPSPLFGPMSHEEWIKLHLRHSELHLSFLIPDA